MSLKQKFLKGAVVVAIGQIGLQGILLLRNILVARLLLPQQFGIALTFVTIINALDALSELGIELFLIRSRGEDDEILQSTLHTMLIIRGLISSLLLFIFAGMIARFFKTPEAVWAYQMLAFIPIIRSVTHLDMRRYEKSLRFLPGAAVSVVSASLGTIFTVYLCRQTADYSAILYGNIFQFGMQTLGSHLIAERRYRLSFNSSHFNSLAAFGMPLVINGIVLFLASQGDRVLVGSSLGMKELAIYGVATLLTTGATALTGRVLGSLFLPVLSNAKPLTPEFDRRFAFCSMISAALSLSMLIVLSTLGPPIARILYGVAYPISATIFTALAIVGVFKILRNLHQAVFIVTSKTSLNLYANLLAVCGIATGGLMLKLGFGILTMVICMMFGEAIALLFSVLSVEGKSTSKKSGGILTFIVVCTLSILLFLGHYFNLFSASITGLTVTALGLLIIPLALAISIKPKKFMTGSLGWF